MSSKERRKFHRAGQAFTLRYRIIGELDASWYEVTTMNISAGGVRFRSPDVMEPESMLQLQVILPNVKEPFVIHGRVVWTQLQASKVLEYGVEFENVTPTQQAHLDDLVQFLRKSGA